MGSPLHVGKLRQQYAQESHLDFIDDRILALVVAIALGLLVGLQREFVGKRIGIRSFALISGIGGVIGLFVVEYGGWILASSILAVTLIIYGHAFLVNRSTPVKGMTTELAALVMFLVGALATSGFMEVAVVTGGAVTLLLHWKAPMHSLVERVGETDFDAIVRFVLITLVVLPILPNATYGPYAVLNPRQIWLMVVLIVSINLAGYVSLKFAGGRGGAVLSGVLGGLISSTATTVSFAKKAQRDSSVAPIAAIIVLVASALVYVRIFVELGVVAPSLIAYLLWPAVAFLVIFAIFVVWSLKRVGSAKAADNDETKNPAELNTALSFSLLYGVVLIISAAVDEHFGENALYPVAVLSGLTDVDAITLSVGRLFHDSRVDGDTAWRLIAVASVSNLAFKSGIVAVLGGNELRRQVLPAMVCLTVIGYLGAWFWP